ncbi:MAG: PIN domain-containing protein [Candidatus Lokiarchaeota archaeon]|nr:PIN domain-containing protein [Candidatus Lokiarchaeota archaeon]MBD3341582.1 PIN domain-containing protein [Candidatus Lokiarchaeota archaeon]
MEMKVSLDTNVFLAVKNKEPEYEYSKKIIDSIEDKQLEGVMSTIVLAEVLVGFFQNKESDKANRFANKALLNYEMIDVTLETAQKAAKIRAETNIKLPDAIISASSIVAEVDYLISQDQKILKKINVKKISPKDFVEKIMQKDNVI